MVAKQQTSIAIFAHNSKEHYSGGRYHAFIMSLALVNAGFNVTLVTDNIPVFYNDFDSYPERESLDILLVKSFKQKYLNKSFDIVILIPGMDGYHNSNIYKLALKQKKIFGSKLIFHNFETPNWFNQYAEQKRSEHLWASWKFIARYSDIILSMTQEAVKYAKEYYGVDDNRHFFCYPAINSRVCDQIDHYAKEKNIICFYRKSHGLHKGGDVIKHLFIEEMRGYTIKLFCGKDRPTGIDCVKLLESANEFGIRIHIVDKASDVEKFIEYKKAELLLFPSQFEGFGYPPVEAIASGTTCLCYDLPVFKEVCANELIYVKHGDIDDFKQKIRECLFYKTQISQAYVKQYISKYSVISMSDKLYSIIENLNTIPLLKMSDNKTLDQVLFSAQTFIRGKNKMLVFCFRILRQCFRMARHYLYLIKCRKSLLQKYSTYHTEALAHGLRDVYKGKRIFVIGNGPSVSYLDLAKMKQEICFCMNRFYLCYENTEFRPNLTFIEDKLMIENHLRSILDNAQTKVIAPEIYTKGFEHESLIKYRLLPNPTGQKFSSDHSKGIYFGASVVYGAIQTAIWCGAKEIYLYGIDHSMDIPTEVDKKDNRIVIAGKENNHFIKNYRDQNEGWCKPDYEMINRSFVNAKNYALKHNITIKNATRGGKLEIFDRVNLDDLLSDDQ